MPRAECNGKPRFVIPFFFFCLHFVILMDKYIMPLPYPRWHFPLSELLCFSRHCQVSFLAMGAISLSARYLDKSGQPTISLLLSAFTRSATLPTSSTVHTIPGASTCQTLTCTTASSMTHPSYVSVKQQFSPSPYPIRLHLACWGLRANLMSVDRA